MGLGCHRSLRKHKQSQAINNTRTIKKNLRASYYRIHPLFFLKRRCPLFDALIISLTGSSYMLVVVVSRFSGVCLLSRWLWVSSTFPGFEMDTLRLFLSPSLFLRVCVCLSLFSSLCLLQFQSFQGLLGNGRENQTRGLRFTVRSLSNCLSLSHGCQLMRGR